MKGEVRLLGGVASPVPAHMLCIWKVKGWLKGVHLHSRDTLQSKAILMFKHPTEHHREFMVVVFLAQVSIYTYGTHRTTWNILSALPIHKMRTT